MMLMYGFFIEVAICLRFIPMTTIVVLSVVLYFCRLLKC
jgi:hypothetical protein